MKKVIVSLTDPPPDVLLLARAVSNSVFSCLLAAEAATTEEEQNKWFMQADKLDSKFKTQYGRHYAELLIPGLTPTS